MGIYIYIYTHYKGNVIIRMNQHIRVTASYVVSCGIWYNLIQLHMCHMYPYVPWSKIGWYNNDIFILVDGHSSILGWMTLKHTPCFDLFFSAGFHTVCCTFCWSKDRVPSSLSRFFNGHQIPSFFLFPPHFGDYTHTPIWSKIWESTW